MGLQDYLDAMARHHGCDLEGLFELIAEHEERLSERLLSFLRARQGVRILGEASSDRGLRVPTVSFLVQGLGSKQVTEWTDQEGIGIRHGDFYAKRLAKALSLDEEAVVRVSMVHYNTLREVDCLVKVLNERLPGGKGARQVAQEASAGLQGAMCAADELEEWTEEDEDAWAAETERDYYAAPGP